MKNAIAMPDVRHDDQNLSNRELLRETCDLASAYLAGVKDRPVARPLDFSALLAKMGGPLPVEGEDPLQVIRVLMCSPRQLRQWRRLYAIG